MYFKYDLKIGLKKNIPVYISAGIYVILSSIVYRVGLKSEGLTGFGLLDYYSYMLRGSRPYIPESGERFMIPIEWLLLQLLVIYMIGNYPLSELYNNHGINILLRGNSRKRWFFSKWLWGVLSILLFYGVCWSVLFFFCVMTKAPLFVQLHTNRGILLEPVLRVKGRGVAELILLPVIGQVTMMSFQLSVSLCWNRTEAVILMMILQIWSAYTFSNFLPGNSMMIYRSEVFLESGTSFHNSLMILLVEMVISLLVGLFVFQRCDILKKQGV